MLEQGYNDLLWRRQRFERLVGSPLFKFRGMDAVRKSFDLHKTSLLSDLRKLSLVILDSCCQPYNSIQDPRLKTFSEHGLITLPQQPGRVNPAFSMKRSFYLCDE
jgi:hypothetical protein